MTDCAGTGRTFPASVFCNAKHMLHAVASYKPTYHMCELWHVERGHISTAIEELSKNATTHKVCSVSCVWEVMRRWWVLRSLEIGQNWAVLATAKLITSHHLRNLRKNRAYHRGYKGDGRWWVSPSPKTGDRYSSENTQNFVVNFPYLRMYVYILMYISKSELLNT